MAITFTWSVKDMHKVTATGAVYKVDWSCRGIDADTEVSHGRTGTYLHMGEVTADEVTGVDDDGNDITESVTRVVPVTPDHTASDFTAYASLAEADVLVWCKAGGIGSATEARITSNITSKIASAANSTGVPW
mgnify:CR=1 FL=1